jgi:spermidine synthase|tara:strand:- start:29 stop:685 length:657 start_codon:yes stop_codon:yes gene_type:complete
LIETAQTPGHGAELCLYQRDQEFAIQADNLELMNSRNFASEQALATLACKKLTDPSEARVLIGGLGMGYTLKSALDELGETAEVLVMELVPDVVRWNQGLLAHLAGNPLDDERVTVQVGDVAQMIKRSRGSFSAILLDVDNGPNALTSMDNHWLYSIAGLETAYAALKPNGILGIWSSDRDAGFAKRLSQVGFDVDEVPVRELGKKGGHHIVWIAERI